MFTISITINTVVIILNTIIIIAAVIVMISVCVADLFLYAQPKPFITSYSCRVGASPRYQNKQCNEVPLYMQTSNPS